MPDPQSYRPKAGSIPTQPGVYRFRDPKGRVIYVGKAINLRQRLANYFQPIPSLHPRTATMVTSAAKVVWTTVSTEVEALLLEYSSIKQFEPRFNVKYRDDKSYPWLAVTLNEEYPRLQGDAWRQAAGRALLRARTPTPGRSARRFDQLLRIFPARTCSKGVFNRSPPDRPSLPAGVHRQVLRSVRRAGVRGEEHRRIVDDFCDFMGGNTGPVRQAASNDGMNDAAADLDFEAAARLRDDLAAMHKGAGTHRGGPPRRHRHRCRRDRRGRARAGRPGVPRAWRPGSGVSAAGWPTRSTMTSRADHVAGVDHGTALRRRRRHG